MNEISPLGLISNRERLTRHHGRWGRRVSGQLGRTRAISRSDEIEGGATKPIARVCFLYIAQVHQVMHSLSAALELARGTPEVEVTIAATDPEVLAFTQTVIAKLGGAPIHWRLLGPGWLRGRRGVPPKLPMLAANARWLARFDAIVTPERTTAALRQMGIRRPKLVYTQHGAGDREGPFEPRLARFDLVFAAGAKQRDRMVGEGWIAPERCAVVGYPKFDLVERLGSAVSPVFRSSRPVVVYNPHFEARLSSFPKWGEKILGAFAAQQEFNLIFAPHVRMFGDRSPASVPALAPFVDHPNIHIDLGDSPAAVDMAYTRAADVYLGDASSQVYEIVLTPRPCVFLNAQGASWQGQESYRHWRFGAVVDEIDALMPALAAAAESQATYQAAQLESRDYTFSLDPPNASFRAAEAIARLIGKTLSPPGF